jgi:hypothetical protein
MIDLLCCYSLAELVLVLIFVSDRTVELHGGGPRGAFKWAWVHCWAISPACKVLDVTYGSGKLVIPSRWTLSLRCS